MAFSHLKQLQSLFSPHSIAIIGASPHPEKVGYIVLKNILSGGFKGEVFLVNPNEKHIEEYVCYSRYADIPRVPDLAVIAVPSAVALTVFPEIAAKGTKSVVIFSAGFKEAGPEGEKLEAQLADLARKHGLAVLGPNCLGFLNTQQKLNVTFGQAAMTPGPLRFITQSGAIATALFDWAEYSGVGFSEFITLGNKTVIGENDIFSYWQKSAARLSSLARRRERTAGLSGYHPIGLYLESIEYGENFIKLASNLSRRDPIFILKPGKSKAAQTAMRSHTGALAGDDAVFEVALERAGVIRCRGAEDLFDLAKGFAWEKAPEGPRVAIVSNAGGPAVMSTDILESEGLALAPLSPAVQKKLAAVLPSAANSHNPVDVLGDALADRYEKAINLVLASKEVDALMVIVTPQVMTQIEETAKVIGRLSKKYQKPIVCSFMGGSLIGKGESVLNSYRIPSFRYPERAIWTLGRMWWWRNWQKETKALALQSLKTSVKKIAVIVGARHEGRSVLSAFEANTLATEWGIHTPPTQLISSFAEAEQFAVRYSFPVVLKISSAKMLHKTEAHGVVTNISNSGGLRAAYDRLAPAVKRTLGAGVQIQKQVDGGVEVIVGIKHDPSFGNVLLLGAGGILAELTRDTRLALLPMDKKSVHTLIQRSKIGKVLNGFRGGKPYAVDVLVDLIFKLMALAQSTNLLKEIEVNPVIVTHTGAWAVDVKAILK